MTRSWATTPASQRPKGTGGRLCRGRSDWLGSSEGETGRPVAESARFLHGAGEPAQDLKSVEGRFVPVYQDHAKGDFWEKSKFAELKNIATVGRVRNWPAPPQPWLSDVTDAKYVLSDMMNKVINQNVSIEDAQAAAQKT
jgi:ABC-type glycerol-3-phosphate transport system substrate-binding protein